jgi:fused signal recognition particle receptor
MSEEKKKGWFQKFKSAFSGGESEPENVAQSESKAPETTEPVGESLTSSPLQPEIPKTEDELVKESLQNTEANLTEIKQSNILPAPEVIITEEELVKESLKTEELKEISTPEIKAQPQLNVKLEIGRGRVRFSDEKETELAELPPRITPEAPLDATPGELRVEDQSIETKPDELPNNDDGKKKSWLTKVVNTLNAPIEFKIDTPEGNASFMAKLKGNVSIGLGKPVIERTDEDLARWRENLVEKLSLTRESFTARLTRLLQGRTRIDDELLEEIEEILLESDVGVEMTDAITNKLRTLAKEKRFLPSEVMPSLFDYLREQLDAESQRIIIDDTRLNIIMMVGVNGTGKTTTTGKMAAKFRISDYSVIMAAADTFRAAAIDQLDVWSQRADVTLVRHQENSDAAAVVYDAIKAAKARNTNVLLIDTAGRLHNKAHLMDELKKIRRIIDREAPEAKLEVLLVLDGTTGQNGLQQATVFSEAVKLTGVVLTKLDGTAKGGVIFSIKNSLKLPIKLVGVGEGIEDLRDFEPQIFIDALFSEKSESIIEESTKIRS